MVMILWLHQWLWSTSFSI